MSRLSLRVRLSALIVALLVMSGAALLAVSYGLVSSSLNAPLGRSSAQPPSGSRPTPSYPLVDTQHELVERTRGQLVRQYLFVLAGVMAVAVALGWFLADRILDAVGRITAVARRVSGDNLTERIALEGPRDELRELADAIDAMLARLDVVVSAQRRFIADASHELRTPLTAMRVEIEVLADDPSAAAADVAASTVVLRRQLARSQELIDALLALARSEPELLAREPVDLAEVVDRALRDVTQAAAARGVRIDAALQQSTVAADRRLLTRLVANLLDNAIKHNDDGGWISVSTTRSGVLEIANSGARVAPDEVEDLTQAFRRGGRTRVGDGHGLGLAIVAAVARAHGGELTIAAPPDGGLRVRVRLPSGPSARAHDDTADAGVHSRHADDPPAGHESPAVTSSTAS